MTPAPSDADKPASGPAGAKPDAARPLPTGPGTPARDAASGASPAALSSVPKVSGTGDLNKPDAKPGTTPTSTPGNPSPVTPGPAGKADPSRPGGADVKSPPMAGSPAAPGPTPKPGPSTVPPSGSAKAEPPKPGDAAKPDPAKPDAAKPASGPGADALRSEASKAEPPKAEPSKAPGPGTRPGGPAGPVAGAAVTAGPILDLKATRVPDAAPGTAKETPKDPAKDASKDLSKDPSKDPSKDMPKAMGASSQGKAPEPGSAAKPLSSPASSPSSSPAPASRGAAAGAAASSVPPVAKSGAPAGNSGSPAAKSGAGFGSIAAAGLLGGVIGAGLLFAVEKAGVGGESGQLNALDQKLSGQISSLDQRIGTLAPKDALAAIDKRVAAAQASAKQAAETAGSAGQGQGVPPDLASRLDSLDQRVSALQEEPGRDVSGSAPMGAAQVEAARQIADLDARVKALEGSGNAGGNSADASQALASLKSDVESRTKQNADAVAALGQRLDTLQQSLGDRVKSATEAVQAATEASRKAAEANQSQAAEASKTVDRKFSEQADKIAALDKGLADRAPASSVQAALRVVVADRIASALASGAPYAEPLATLTKLDSQAQGQTAALTPFADKGAPTVGQLAETFRGIGQSIAQARQAARTKAAAESGDFRTKLLSMADGLVQVRKVDAGTPAEGPASAPEEKVQAALDRGDLAAAASAFEALPDDAKAQAKDFGATLSARAKAAQAARSLTASAFAALPAPSVK